MEGQPGDQRAFLCPYQEVGNIETQTEALLKIPPSPPALHLHLPIKAFLFLSSFLSFQNQVIGLCSTRGEQSSWDADKRRRGRESNGSVPKELSRLLWGV